jgi:hypothetical protein
MLSTATTYGTLGHGLGERRQSFDPVAPADNGRCRYGQTSGFAGIFRLRAASRSGMIPVR